MDFLKPKNIMQSVSGAISVPIVDDRKKAIAHLKPQPLWLIFKLKI